jgi:hypothetical protein
MKTAVIRGLCLFASVLVAGAASAQQAVEWKVSDGGNGHWYRYVATRLTWPQADAACIQARGHLVTLTSASENAFVNSIVASRYLAGGFQTATACEPSCDWQWSNGEPWGYTNWNSGEPNNAGNEDYLLVNPGFPGWNDITTESIEYVIEWDADCNGDGIVDYGQIQRGELADLNGNGVPDVCEVSVSGVTPPSVPSQGGSTITIRGTNFQGTPSVKIGGVPATNVVTVSPISLTATCPALLPGMASIQVNGFTLQDAIYIRPECGSDLDQNGFVDAGDISIILLDFGPCYSNAASNPPEDSKPFMLREEAAPVGPNAR